MPGHRRVKDFDVDEDDEQDYAEVEGEDVGDEESKEQMRQGITAVRKELDASVNASNQEIEDALWYYYFDVAKSVEYIKGEHVKKQKPIASRFELAAHVAQKQSSDESKEGLKIVTSDRDESVCHNRLTAAEFFKGTPWLDVPASHLGNIIMEPLYPRVRLLGGSGTGKPSKLAALAAARKKTQEEKRSTVNSPPTNLMNQMRIDALPVTDSEVVVPLETSVEGASKRPFPFEETRPRTYPQRKSLESHEQPTPLLPPTDVAGDHMDSKIDARDLTASPSVFARTMLGRDAPPAAHLMEPRFSMPYPESASDKKSGGFSGPSPDDLVTKAQGKDAKSNKSSKRPNETTGSGVAEGVSKIKLEDAVKPRSKGLDVAAEFKKSNAKNAANFVVIGHVDHGKSTLMGRLLLDLKLVNSRSVEKYRTEATGMGKSSFALAWVMDSTAEERQRGVTVDIATNHFETETTRFTILDAPGHRDFIPNMIAGAAQADFAVLVVDASTNAFESGLRGQTKEHALLVRSMGISRLVVAINKMDVAGWSEDRYNEISQQLTAFLTTAGFHSKSLAFVPCAGLTGENVVVAPPTGTMPWYTGGTLVASLDASEPARRRLQDPLRLTISDVFRGGTQNPVSISGRLDAGSLQPGDTILAQPSGESASIKAIDVDGIPAEWTVAGQIAVLHLSGIDPVHLRAGDVICNPAHEPVQNVTSFIAKVLAFEHIMPGPLELHKGRMHAPVKVTEMLAVLEKSGGKVEKKRPRVVKPGAIARIRVELDLALPVEVPSRIVLRASGNTVAAGLVEEVV